MNCRVVVIDSGTNEYFKKKVKKLYSFYDDEYLDKNGHGTKCISLINNLAPEVEIYVFKLLDEKLKCTSDDLYRTLLKLLDMEMDIINLSLSTANISQFDKIDNICHQLVGQGKILIASKSNNGEISYPAESKYVIGVGGNQFTKNEEFWFNINNPIQCIASRTPCIVDLGNLEYTFYSGNSKAAACLTGILARNFDALRNLNFKERMEYISSLATSNIWTQNDITTDLIWCERFTDTDPEILGYLNALFKNYNLNSNKLLYECVGINEILCAVKSIIQDYYLDLSKGELNLYDFMSLQSLSMKIKCISKKSREGDSNY